MKLGAMNNPSSPVAREIARIAGLGFGFMDLTSEPPNASSELLKKKSAEIRDALSSHNLGVVGHTAWYHEFANPYESVRRAHIAEFKASAEILAGFGAEKVGIHPDNMAFAHKNRGQYLARFTEACVELNRFCKDLGVMLTTETYEERFLDARELRAILDSAPGMGFTLDIGHANLIRPEGAGIELLIKEFKAELCHAHASDNDGKSDLHLPIGAGKIDWAKALSALKRAGYDSTITLEVFSPDQDYLAISKKKFEALWSRASAE
ncbi:MAG: sugar phosphate isomerase/epimerase [Candidatus ainarchaeum sp.]|nr:sugar phosphate isomerase/epimerase [Candidatus ainarchaeum sp.]